MPNVTIIKNINPRNIKLAIIQLLSLDGLLFKAIMVVDKIVCTVYVVHSQPTTFGKNPQLSIFSFLTYIRPVAPS